MSPIEESRNQRRTVAFGIDIARDKDKTALYAARYRNIPETEQEIHGQLLSCWHDMGKKIQKIIESLEQGGMP